MLCIIFLIYKKLLRIGILTVSKGGFSMEAFTKCNWIMLMIFLIKHPFSQ